MTSFEVTGEAGAACGIATEAPSGPPGAALLSDCRPIGVGDVIEGVAGSGIAFSERGEHVLKGIPDQWRLFAVQR